jgi:hypothetical protein
MRPFELLPDCGSCAALCCVATAFDASESFAFSKPAGKPCRHLCGNRCGIHAELIERGMRGCAAFDCYGAGQRATKEAPEAERHAAFFVLRELHELLWLLTEAAKLCPPELADVFAAQTRLLGSLSYDADLRLYRDATYALLRCCQPSLKK